MANALLCFTYVNSIKSPAKSSISPKSHTAFRNPSSHLPQNPTFACAQNSKFQSLKAKATESNRSTKPNSIVCADCDGNGAISCKQCKGTGVNAVDHFNGQFKAGASCWLCRGKREILCGNCNGAGFVGGFMSTFDE